VERGEIRPAAQIGCANSVATNGIKEDLIMRNHESHESISGKLATFLSADIDGRNHYVNIF